MAEAVPKQGDNRMEFDADTLKDIQAMLSFAERIVQSQKREISEEKKKKVGEITEHPDAYFVDGDELMIHSSNPLLERNRGDIKADIPFERIKTVDLIGDASNGFFNAVYVEKAARFLFPSATKYLSSSAYLHFDSFKKALEKRMGEAVDSYETLWFGFAYGGDLYTLEFVGDDGLDLYCASHPFGNVSFEPLAPSLANMESPRIEGRYIEKLSIKGEGIPSLSSFRQGLYESGVESLLDQCVNLKEIKVDDDCPLKEEIMETAKRRGIKVI